MFDKFYVRLMCPQYCRICGRKLLEHMEPDSYNPFNGHITAFKTRLHCPQDHVAYTYTDKAPKGFSVTRTEWEKLDAD